MKKASYARGVAVMLGIAMPVTCLFGSIAAWLDPEERASFLQTLLNNGVALYVLAVVPAIALSILHTRLTQTSRLGTPVGSIAIGTVLGLVMAVSILLMLTGMLSAEMLPVLLWGGVTGALYAALSAYWTKKRRLLASGEVARGRFRSTGRGWVVTPFISDVF